MFPGKTPRDLADFVNEQEMTAFLASCETGLIPPNPPKKQVFLEHIVALNKNT